MSLASSGLLFTHRCAIERNEATGAWGDPAAPDWQESATDVPCRVWTTAGREAVDATTTAVIEDMRLLVAIGTDVTEQDRIGDITERGDTLVSGPVGIRAVLRNQDHLELVLVKLS